MLFIMRLTIIIGVCTNKGFPDGFVRLIIVGPLRRHDSSPSEGLVALWQTYSSATREDVNAAKRLADAHG